MLTAEHQKPLVGFMLVFAVACLIMVNGLRTQVVDVLIGSGAPRQLITAIAPDMVLGQSLRNVPAAPQPTGEQPASAQAPVQPVALPAVVTVAQSGVRTASGPTASVKASNRAGRDAARPVRSRGGQVTAPGVVAPAAPTPAPTPAPAPAPDQPIPGVRIPGVRIPHVPLLGDRAGWSNGNEQRGDKPDRTDHRPSWTAPSRSELVPASKDTDTRPTWDSNPGSGDRADRARWGSSSHGGWKGDSGPGHRSETRGSGRTDRGQREPGQVTRDQTSRGQTSWGQNGGSQKGWGQKIWGQNGGSGHGRSGHGH
jgi:hypothetical protein